MKLKQEGILDERRAGILLHITSLPGTDGAHGKLDKEAYYFVDFMKNAGISVWQTLPLGMPHADGSPYQCLSAHAGNTNLINIDWFVEKGWLEIPDICADTQCDPEFRKTCLITEAFSGFQHIAGEVDVNDFARFCQEKAAWLDEYALFLALRSEFDNRPWYEWPEPFKNRDPVALKAARHRLIHFIGIVKFEQYVFFRQWKELRDYAHEQGVFMFGDIPIFVAYDSADVWSKRENFKLDESGKMLVVAGVPPDYFSETGQRWGNPHFDWEYMEQNGFKWWLERIKTQLETFDILRIDHFRGLEAAWEIPSDEETAINGQWVKAPGEALLTTIKEKFGSIPLVAEDLGVITNEVEALRDKFELPGMKILQFAFNGGIDNAYLPHNHTENCVVYTGTHDNDTTLGWYNSISDQEKHFFQEYFGSTELDMPCALMNAAMASVAHLAIVPMQDVLKLGSEHRMNTPGTMGGNWHWRFSWDQLTDEFVHEVAHLVGLFGRRKS